MKMVFRIPQKLGALPNAEWTIPSWMRWTGPVAHTENTNTPTFRLTHRKRPLARNVNLAELRTGLNWLRVGSCSTPSSPITTENVWMKWWLWSVQERVVHSCKHPACLKNTTVVPDGSASCPIDSLVQWRRRKGKQGVTSGKLTEDLARCSSRRRCWTPFPSRCSRNEWRHTQLITWRHCYHKHWVLSHSGATSTRVAMSGGQPCPRGIPLTA
jgi:hypothetical protein